MLFTLSFVRAVPWGCRAVRGVLVRRARCAACAACTCRAVRGPFRAGPLYICVMCHVICMCSYYVYVFNTSKSCTFNNPLTQKTTTSTNSCTFNNPLKTNQNTKKRDVIKLMYFEESPKTKTTTHKQKQNDM